MAERVLYEAARHTPLKPVVVRVGQICGGINGAWNVTDWVPAIVKSSLVLGCLPAFKGVSKPVYPCGSTLGMLTVPSDIVLDSVGLGRKCFVGNAGRANLHVPFDSPSPCQRSRAVRNYGPRIISSPAAFC